MLLNIPTFANNTIIKKLQPEYNPENNQVLIEQNNKQLVQIVLNGYKSYDQALEIAAQLKKQKLISRIEVLGTKNNNKWAYLVVIAEQTTQEKANLLKFKFKQLSFSNIVVNALPANKSLEPLLSLQPERLDFPSIQLAESKYINQISDEVVLKDAIVLNDDDTIILIDDGDDSIRQSDSDINLLEDEIISLESSSNKQLEWGGLIQLEQQVFSQSSSVVDQLQYLHIDAYQNWQINSLWSLNIGARIDGNYQHGTSQSSDTQFDYTDTYLRFRDDNYRITMGAQTIIWGRMDNFSPTDRLATMDLSRGVLTEWGENYRSQVAFRTELFLQQSKFDFAYIPQFRAAQLSEQDQSWYPINFIEGRILGFGSDPLMSVVLKNSQINKSFSKKDALALRYSTTRGQVDYALSLQHIQLSAPYYRFDPRLAQLITNPQLLNLANPSLKSQFTLYEEHPKNWIIGADMAFEWKDITWRFEAAWLSDVPATTPLLIYKKFHGLDWASGLEFYPGDSDTRVNIQLSGKHIFNNENIVDRDNSISLSGSIESEFDNGKWKLSTRYSLGLDLRDIYISPEISYLGWEPYEFYSAYHFLDGAEQSIGGFYKNNKLFSLGLRIKH
ncbi:MAG: hypothetical protein QM479_04310 [Pseudomonadota bacterium]